MGLDKCPYCPFPISIFKTLSGFGSSVHWISDIFLSQSLFIYQPLTQSTAVYFPCSFQHNPIWVAITISHCPTFLFDQNTDCRGPSSSTSSQTNCRSNKSSSYFLIWLSFTARICVFCKDYYVSFMSFALDKKPLISTFYHLTIEAIDLHKLLREVSLFGNNASTECALLTTLHIGDVLFS